MLHKLIAPACAFAALTLSSTAFAGDPVDASLEASEPTSEVSGPVEASEPVTLSNEVAASAAEGMQRTVHGGRFALGAARTLAGLNGINARYYISDHFHLGLNIGVATFSFRESDIINDGIDCGTSEVDPACTKTVRTVAYIGSSLEGVYWILGKPAGNLPFQADFGIGGRLGFQHEVNAADIPLDLDDPLQFTFEVPLILALNLGENFSINPEFGVVFRWNPGTRLTDNVAMPPDPGDSNPGFESPAARVSMASGPGFGFEITDGIGLFGGASLVYAF